MRSPLNNSPTMRPRLVLLLSLCFALAHSKPVKRKLNFNMFVLKPTGDDYEQAPLKILLSTNGVSRFGPLLEYLVQRVQGMLSVRVHPEDVQVDAAQDNVVEDAGDAVNVKGAVLRPSRNKPGTYEVEIPVTVDDGQPLKP